MEDSAFVFKAQFGFHGITAKLAPELWRDNSGAQGATIRAKENGGPVSRSAVPVQPGGWS
jgi:hypothetical protein